MNIPSSHASRLHASCFTSLPGQSRPPGLGRGFVQDRYRVRHPPPQVLLQGVCIVLQGDHPPSKFTGRINKETAGNHQVVNLVNKMSANGLMRQRVRALTAIIMAKIAQHIKSPAPRYHKISQDLKTTRLCVTN